MFLVKAGTIILVVVVLLVLLLVFWIVKAYNGLVVMRNRVKNSWSQIDVQLQRRFDLIPNLVETVKSYATHEKDIFGAFAKARTMFESAKAEGNVQGMAQANESLGTTLGRLMVVQESYPELKADASFNKMMADLKETEDKIAYTRQFYNDSVLQYNNKREVFPTVIIANLFSFKEAEYFKIAEGAKEAPKVKFN